MMGVSNFVCDVLSLSVLSEVEGSKGNNQRLLFCTTLPRLSLEA
jgi:hypothetical protein